MFQSLLPQMSSWGGHGFANTFGTSTAGRGSTEGGGGGGEGGGGGGPGGGDTRGMFDLGQQFKASQDAANAANEARYQKLLGLAQQFGAAQRARNAQLVTQQQGQAQQSLMSRGLGNSTVVDSVRTQIGDQGAMRDLAIDEAANQQMMGVIERRTDQQPNLGMMAGLATQPGSMDLLSGMFGGRRPQR